MWDFPKGLHVLLGAFLLGSLAFSYLGVLVFVKRHDALLLRRFIKYSLWLDAVSFFALAVLFFSATQLVYLKGYDFSVHWIQAAYLLLVVVSFFWLSLAWIKFKNYQSLSDASYKKFKFKKIFHIFHILIIVSFLMIIHDAMTRSSFFNGF